MMCLLCSVLQISSSVLPQLSLPAGCTSAAVCRCHVAGVTQINGEYRMQALVSASTKRLRLQVSTTLKDMGATYSTQYLQAGLTTMPNMQLQWLQASSPLATTRPMIIRGSGPTVGSRLRVDANIASGAGVRCTVPIVIEFVSTLPALPAGRPNGVQLMSSAQQKGL